MEGNTETYKRRKTEKDENGKDGNKEKIRGGRKRRMRMKILSGELEEFLCGPFDSIHVPIFT